MADAELDAKLSEEEKNAARNWVLEKAGTTPPTCPVCRNQTWAIGDHFVAPVTFSSGYVFGGVAYPHFMLICRTCSNTQFINSVAAGIRKPSDSPGVKPEGNPEIKQVEAQKEKSNV